MEFIAVDLQPFSVVEDVGFKRLINELQPKYHIPSRHNAPALKELIREALEEFNVKEKSFIFIRDAADVGNHVVYWFAATARILVLVRTNAGSAQNLAMRLHHAHLHMTPKRDSAQKSHAVCAGSTMTFDQSASAVISTEPISNQNDEALSQFITEQIVTEDNNNINDAAEWASQPNAQRRAYSIQEKVEILDFAKKVFYSCR
ncbi:hypothetical protein niasHT_024229 [Heterodera trifolii]|uniref:Uncharacterized protein n=1 Tax=Heterodera trifolii TaxID=157864 RepID=A0ABD2JM49_9BILA